MKGGNDPLDTALKLRMSVESRQSLPDHDIVSLVKRLKAWGASVHKRFVY
jgi:hypothetical protein